ncbi:beta-glucosidase 11-like isoform X2 [Punica granatum]|uniref:beta-glucosidase n=1 Tax=Punica granatum TaxID=22663 RepID=A0A6P8EA56_PUNGR|nr:beta-glucosidase 11-like isoform X2 [Punica granatum]
MWKLCRFLLFMVSFRVGQVSGADKYSRHDFPPGFVFGAGTSAYQVEGAAEEDGRTPSIFDTYAHSGITRGANGDVACDQYHKYKEDVQLMAEMGLEAYRFSISWSRLIPNGRGQVNPKGLQYYNNLINELISHGIEPHVTLHHSDHPQALEDEYGGWISRRVVRDFTAYADVCFREFGDRVRHWTTFNEANVFVQVGYDYGLMPPQRCSSPFGILDCQKGNSSTEPYLAAHNILLGHASAARLYQKKYRHKQKGYVGLNLLGFHFTPFTNTTEDIVATQRANDFYHGWFADPLIYGDYPETMKKIVGSRLPSFDQIESRLVKGSADFLAINFYFAEKVKDSPQSLEIQPKDYKADIAVELDCTPNKFVPFLYPVNPWALQGILEYFKQKYGNPPMYIHENGQRMQRNSSLEDWPRVKCLQGYIGAVLDSLRNGSDVRGYFTWSLLDVFELLDGYNSGFGLYYVDLDDPDLKRCPKLSARWYSHFLKGGSQGPGSGSLIEQLQDNSSSVSPDHGLIH